MRVVLTVAILACVWFATSCGRGSHSIKCVAVNGQTVCFVRQLWGLNGDRVALTTSENVCHQPSSETDFVSDTLGAGGLNHYKIHNGKLYVYGSVGRMIRPSNEFPVAVEFDFERFGGTNPSEAVLQSHGYTRLQLEDWTWCFSDFY